MAGRRSSFEDRIQPVEHQAKAALPSKAAALTLEYIDMIRQSIERGDADSAADVAFLLGRCGTIGGAEIVA
jgi:hypothetical protein